MNAPSKKAAVVATAAVLSLGGAAYAATSATTAPTPLTGNSTDKVAAAAVAKFPGSTLVGIQSRSDGTYDAQVRKSDGTSVQLTLDKDFTVTATRTGGPGRGGPGGLGGGPGGPGGPGHGVDTAAIAKTLGVSEADLKAAIAKVAPDDKADRAAAIAKSLGVSQADVQAVLDAQKGGQGGPGRGRGRGHGDDSALVTALAGKLNVSEDKVRTALDAARPDPGDRDTALATALAKELNLDVAKVKAALDAARPAGRP